MAQFQNAAMLLCASSPYARKGELWRTYNKFFGKSDAPALVWCAATRIMNPSIPQSVIDAALADDPSSAAAEYGAQFRTDIESFVSLEVVNACVSAGIYERGPQRDVGYHGFCDPSGGSADSMTLAIGHYVYDQEVIVIDALRETKPPFNPEAVVDQFATLIKTYGISQIIGDKYAGIWPAAEFAKVGIGYEASAEPKSTVYQNLLPLLNSKRIELLDSDRLVNQLVGLERRTARSGKDSIDHMPGAHDDIANAVAGLAAISAEYGGYDTQYRGFQDDPDGKDSAESWRAARLNAYLLSGGRVHMSGALHISLSTDQLKVLLAGAARVPQKWRRRFLDDVADQLLWHLARAPSLVPPIIEDAIVQQAVQSTLKRIGLTQKEPQACDHD